MAAQSANCALGQLGRAFHFRRASSFIPLYKMFVRPKLEHAVAAWSPWLEGDKEKMEKVQRRLIRMVSDKKGITYEEQLKSVRLTSLAERRARGDMMETYKTKNGLNRVDKNNKFRFRDQSNSKATRSTVSVLGLEQRERKNVLFKETIRLDTRKNCVSVRVVDQRNAIPDKIKTQKSIYGFKDDRYDEWI